MSLRPLARPVDYVLLRRRLAVPNGWVCSKLDSAHHHFFSPHNSLLTSSCASLPPPAADTLNLPVVAVDSAGAVLRLQPGEIPGVGMLHCHRE